MGRRTTRRLPARRRRPRDRQHIHPSETTMSEIKRRERDAILQSLQAGLVPRLGLHLLQVGRKDEVAALLKDLERIEQGGAAFRIVVGRFGSGKSFFLNL